MRGTNTFTDSKGRSWTLRITPFEMREVRDFAGISLGTILQNNMEPLANLLADEVDLCSVLWAICKEQAERKGIDLKDFMEGIVGDPIEDATAAFLEGLHDCFPSKKRAPIRATLILMKTDPGKTKQKVKTLLSQLTYISSHSRWQRFWAWIRGATRVGISA